MTTRYFAEEPCEHGEMRDHWIPDTCQLTTLDIPGVLAGSVGN